MENKWVRIGDKVVVIAGNEKGQTGSVVARSKDKKRVVVEGLNVRKKHVKPQQGRQQGIVSLEAPIHASNVRLCDEAGVPLKVKVKIDEEGKRKLVYHRNGKEEIYRAVKEKKA